MLERFAPVSVDHIPFPYKIKANGITYLQHPEQLTDEEILSTVYGVTEAVYTQNLQKQGSMYVRTPEQYIKLFREGIVTYLRVPSGEFAYFAGSEPVLSPKQVEALGCQLMEVGNCITNPNLTQNGFGSIGNYVHSKNIFEKSGPNTLSYFVSETGYMAVAHKKGVELSGHHGSHAVSAHEFPYIATQTCKWSAKGLDESHNCNVRRRSSQQSTREELEKIYEHRIGEMPCTLVVSDVNMAVRFQERSRQLHYELLGEDPVVLKPGEELTVDHILRIDNFYERLRDCVDAKAVN